LRYDSPVQTLVRSATMDTKVSGTPVECGGLVAVLFGAANRDPAQSRSRSGSVSRGHPTTTSPSGRVSTSVLVRRWHGSRRA